MSDLILADATVVVEPPQHPLAGHSVLIRGRRVVDVFPTRAEAVTQARKPMALVDLTGMTIVPGFIDCHVHLFHNGAVNAAAASKRDPDFARRRALLHLHAGVTTVRDLNAPIPEIFALRDEIASQQAPGPRILAAGPILTTPGGHGSFDALPVTTREELISAVRLLDSFGADCIKISVSGGVSDPTSDLFAVQFEEDDVRAAVEASHGLGLRVAAHASNPRSVAISARAGVDSIEHAVLMDEDALATLAESASILVPTLTATSFDVTKLNDPQVPTFVRDKAQFTVPAHRPSIRRAVKAGIPMAVGTDAGSTFTEHGWAALEAFELSKCGLAPCDALASLTSVAARAIGRDHDLGRIAPGAMADMVVLGSDPLREVKALQDVRLVVHDGRLVTPRGMPAQRG